MQEETFVLTPSPNLSPKGERNLKNEETMLPLDGIRVIEVGQALAGPLAGVLLADMGADVIKIEKPDGGDDARIWGPPFGPDGVTSLYFYSARTATSARSRSTSRRRPTSRNCTGFARPPTS